MKRDKKKAEEKRQMEKEKAKVAADKEGAGKDVEAKAAADTRVTRASQKRESRKKKDDDEELVALTHFGKIPIVVSDAATRATIKRNAKDMQKMKADEERAKMANVPEAVKKWMEMGFLQSMGNVEGEQLFDDDWSQNNLPKDLDKLDSLTDEAFDEILETCPDELKEKLGEELPGQPSYPLGKRMKQVLRQVMLHELDKSKPPEAKRKKVVSMSDSEGSEYDPDDVDEGDDEDDSDDEADKLKDVEEKKRESRSRPSQKQTQVAKKSTSKGAVAAKKSPVAKKSTAGAGRKPKKAQPVKPASSQAKKTRSSTKQQGKRVQLDVSDSDFDLYFKDK